MSNSVLSGRGRLILSQAACYPSLAALRVGRTRTFSAASSDEPYTHVSHTESGPRTVWPDESMGPFGPQDQRFQLPGNVGFDCHLDGTAGQRKSQVHRTVPDVLTAPSSTDRHQFILAQFVNEFHGNLDPMSTRVHKAEQYFNQAGANCSINSCPELLRRDMELLFPSAPTNPITVVTVTQRSSQCGEAAEHDRDQLLQRFVNGAKEMCFSLWTAGYWADFIDPTTGAAFFASISSQTTLQTEEGLRHLGFHIEASGSCTVIRHILRGAPLFVGTVFTNAPTHSATIARLQGVSNGLDDEE
ncbi:metabolism of cobalamin associated Da [Takifugu rubripes]|uniref:Metabolism of cobalamin associated Da n=2 Tax=Takifugu TaxID=31032 RepID=A0A3B5KII6_TAKRU|nr:methylmalonic aciduria and homocystinuria type D homolog, mitochondrial-like [Takifugu rubripes]XP_011604465.2 methylmalonic aciduria and homocystinuria type D homolog, mitochondrial-like [Takifugu rubripes]XP_056883213.1 metabolism of cobalamin associated Da [Takifugu flavidus]XP_056883214.1 metabolism of cobalamin associated Da [Takifugu flavidus]XP_056883215.1 metabolism of cobalamin associated Da [Takifugu flavidus]TWW64084.1 Methylmalonic aciduria and homocystinuria type D -like protei